jgi:hypothetical protein
MKVNVDRAALHSGKPAIRVRMEESDPFRLPEYHVDHMWIDGPCEIVQENGKVWIEIKHERVTWGTKPQP